MMRFTLSILSSMFFLIFLLGTAHGIDWASPSFDADEMISAGEETVVTSPEITPWESRELQKNKSSLDWTMPSTLTGSGEGPKESREQAQSSETDGSASSEDKALAQNNTTTAYSQPPASRTETVNVQGNWIFTLNDSSIRDLYLSLFQDGQNVFGTGKIKEENNSMDVTASGNVGGSNLEMNLVSTNPIIHYKLNLTVDQNWSVGEYRASSVSGESWMGRAEGQRS